MTVSCTDRHKWAKPARLMFVAAVGITGVLLTGGADAQANGGARYDFRVFPRVGTPATTFRVAFTAPFRGGVDEYTLEAVGPRRCPSVFEFPRGLVRRGDRVVMRLTPSDDLYFRSRRRWCRGTYVGYVSYTPPASLSDRVIGYFSFGVGRYPVSLGA